jgi:hypothetical protein
MRIRGLFIGLILALLVVYLLWFVKTGKKSRIEKVVDRYTEAKIDLTRVSMASLEKVIVTFMGSEGRAPESLQELRSLRIGLSAAIDGWGRNIRYEKLSDSSFRMLSAGQDGIFDTSDDIVSEY